MVKQIIERFLTLPQEKIPGDDFLNISEFYYDTIQGEGITTGHPAAFLRLKGCSLNCNYCDTLKIWRSGNSFSFSEVFSLMNSTEVIEELQEGQHLVLTGGSPLVQQDRLVRFFSQFRQIYGFQPFIEIENECVIMPEQDMVDLVNTWNNSPKLANSGVVEYLRYKPKVIIEMSKMEHTWFKFVVTSEEDWNEIDKNFIKTGFIWRNQVILMPEGATREELLAHQEMVVQMAVQHRVRFCNREHIIVWNNKLGV